MTRNLFRLAAAGVTTSAALVLLAVPAFAHITVTPGSVTAGSAAVLTLHVPNEEAKADTVSVDVQIPTDHPIAQLLAKPVPGWTVTVKYITLAKPLVTDDGTFSQAVSEVIWSGGTITPGQFQDFSVSADPVPDGVSRLVFKAIQTYSNGDVVRWIDIPEPGQPSPDHPAAVLTVTSGPAVAPATAASTNSTSGSGSSTLALAVGLGGLVAGLAGLILAGLMWRRRAPLPDAPPRVAPDPMARTAPKPAAPVPPGQSKHAAPVKAGQPRQKTSGSRRR